MSQPSDKRSVPVELTHDGRNLCEIRTEMATRLQVTLVMDDEEFVILRRVQRSVTR